MSAPTTAPADNDVNLDNYVALQQDSEVQTSVPITKPAESFVAKCIHPPSAVPGFRGIPTNDARSQVLLEWRHMSLMSQVYDTDPATGLVRVATVAPSNYSWLIPNGARTLAIGFAGEPTNANWQQDYNNVLINDTYNFSNWSKDANLFRPIYKSLSLAPNVTAFNNTGYLTACQFNPSILFAGTLLTMSFDKPRLFVDFCVSHIKRRLRLEADDDGFVKVSTKNDKAALMLDFPSFVKSEVATACERLRLPLSKLNLDPNTTIQVLNLNASSAANGLPVPTMSQVLQASMRSYGGKFTEGAFTINRLNTIAPAWQSASNTTIGTNPDGLYQCYTFSTLSDGSAHFVPLHDNLAVGTSLGTAPALRDTLWSKDMTFTWIHLAGLSYNVNQTPATLNQLMAMKFYTGYEVQPANESAWSGMVNLAPKPDLEAMQALMDAFYELKDCFPVSYNFWGTLGSLAANGLKEFGSSILKNLVSGATKKSKPAPKARRRKSRPVTEEIVERLEEVEIEDAPRRQPRPPREQRAPANTTPRRTPRQAPKRKARKTTTPALRTRRRNLRKKND